MANGSAAGPSGIIPRTYKSGSIIYFEGDKSEYIYILKSGRVVLTTIKLDTGEEIREEVRQGEFFGVKSSLGKYPREETAQTIGNTVVLIMNLADFERLILRNVNVVRKMLRVFSNQLRRYGKMRRSILGEDDEVNPEVELFRIGEYYYKAAVFQQAQYAFKKYMEYYPDAQYADIAMERIKAINSGQAVPDDVNIELRTKPKNKPADNNMDDFTFDEPDNSGDDMLDYESKPKNDMKNEKSPLSGEMDDFISDNNSDGFGDFTFDTPDGEEGEKGFSNIFNKAVKLYEGGNYNGSLDLLKKILSSTQFSSAADKKIFENAHFEAGRCYMKIGKLKEASELFSKVIKSYPNSEKMKNSLFHIGVIFEMANQKDKALLYYNKVLDMTPKDEINNQASKKIKQLQGG